MAYRILNHGETSAVFGPVGSGNIIVQAEVGVYSVGPPRTLGQTDMASGEQWSVEQADADVDEADRIWSAVHFTGSGGSTAYNGITDENRILSFFVSDGYVYRVRKNAPASAIGTNVNVAITWDQVRMRIWHG